VPQFSIITPWVRLPVSSVGHCTPECAFSVTLPGQL
jgi:hypothetical protein